MRMYEWMHKTLSIFLVLFFWNENNTFFLWWCINGCTKLYFFVLMLRECIKLYFFFCFDFKRMHKTLFFTFSFFFMRMHEQCIKLYVLYFSISFKMYFQNSSYVIECSMDAFEDKWWKCKYMMYVKLCDDVQMYDVC